MRPRPTLVAVIVLALQTAILAGGPTAAQHPRGLLAAVRAAECTIESRPLSFGAYEPTDVTPVLGTSSVTFTCNAKMKSIRIEMSRGGSSSYDRRMASVDNYLNYNVYLDSAYTTVWGDGSSGTDVYLEKAPQNTPVVVPAFGRIFALQDVATGQYTDVLQVTIQF